MSLIYSLSRSGHLQRMRRIFCAFAALLLLSSASVWADDLSPSGTSPSLARNHEPLLASNAKASDAADARAPEVAKVIRRLKPKTGAMVVAWSPDSKLLATMGGVQGRITLWDAGTGQIVWDVLGERTGSEALAFSNDGRLLLTTVAKNSVEDQGAALSLWDVATGKVVGRVPGFFPGEGPIANFARQLSVDRAHALLAVIASNSPGDPVGIYDMRDWVLQGTIAVEKDSPTAVAFGPDGTLAIGTIGGQIALFGGRTRVLKRAIDAGPGGVKSLAYSPGGEYVVSGALYGPDPIRVWSTTDGTLVRSYTAKLSGVHGLSWSPDGRYIASASLNGPIWLWPFATDSSAQSVEAFGSGAWSIAFSPDGKLLAAGSSQDDVIIAEIRQLK